jgi:arsenical pump membrane protein
VVIEIILATLAVGATAIRPASWPWAVTAGLAAAADLGVTGAAPLGAAVSAAVPVLAFLLAAVGLAGLAVRRGLAGRAADLLAAAARRRAAALYLLVCATTALLTAVVSLDGAVVVMVPVVVELARRHGAPTRPLLLGVVAVANAFSLALPEGNPTNLLVARRLDLGLGEFVVRAGLAGTAAAVLCAAAVGWRERPRLSGRLPATPAAGPVPTAAGRYMGGVARLGVQLVALLVVLLPLAPHVRWPAAPGAAGAVVTGLAVAAAAALVNNLPATAVAAAALAPGAGAYAALAGLSVGALATPHGSVATMLAADLAGERAHTAALLPLAFAGTALAAALVWLSPF